MGGTVATYRKLLTYSQHNGDVLIKTGMAAWPVVTHRSEGREIDSEVWRRERGRAVGREQSPDLPGASIPLSCGGTGCSVDRQLTSRMYLLTLLGSHPATFRVSVWLH